MEGAALLLLLTSSTPMWQAPLLLVCEQLLPSPPACSVQASPVAGLEAAIISLEREILSLRQNTYAWQI